MDRQLLGCILMIHGNLVLDYTKLYTSPIAIEYDMSELIADQ